MMGVAGGWAGGWQAALHRKAQASPYFPPPIQWKGVAKGEKWLRSPKDGKVETYPTSHSTMDQADPILEISSGMRQSGFTRQAQEHVDELSVWKDEEDWTKLSRLPGGRMTEDRISQEVRRSAGGCHSWWPVGFDGLAVGWSARCTFFLPVSEALGHPQVFGSGGEAAVGSSGCCGVCVWGAAHHGKPAHTGLQ